MITSFHDTNQTLTKVVLYKAINMENQEEDNTLRPRVTSAHGSTERVSPGRVDSPVLRKREIRIENLQQSYDNDMKKARSSQSPHDCDTNEIGNELKAFPNTSVLVIDNSLARAGRVNFTHGRNDLHIDAIPKDIPHKIRFQAKNVSMISKASKNEIESRYPDFIGGMPSIYKKKNSPRGEQMFKKAHVKRFGKQLSCQLKALKQTYEQALTAAERIRDDESKTNDYLERDIKNNSASAYDNSSKQLDDPLIKGYDGDKEYDDEVSNES
jgi:hypothetical protein